MNVVAAAVEVEARKFRASRVVWSTTALVVVGICGLTAALDRSAESGNEQILAQLGDLAEESGWVRLVGIALQITSAAGLLALGVVLAWSVGREFTDGTITGLFALPVPLRTLAAAKLLVVAAWSALVAIALAAAVTATGVVLGLGPPDAAALGDLARLATLVALSCLLALPAAWAASLGRGLLPGIATTVVTIAVAQVFAVAGTGAWFPFAAPALWAMEVEPVSIVQLALVFVVAGLFAALTLRAWSRLQLDR